MTAPDEINDHERLMLTILQDVPGISEETLLSTFERLLDVADGDPEKALAAYLADRHIGIGKTIN